MEAKGGKGGGGPSFVLPEEDEAATSSRHVVPPVALRSTSPRNITNTANSKAKEGEREDEKHWTLAELKGWAARLDERERAIAEREASLDKRAQWLDQQQVNLSLFRFRFLLRSLCVTATISFGYFIYILFIFWPIAGARVQDERPALSRAAGVGRPGRAANAGHRASLASSATVAQEQYTPSSFSSFFSSSFFS
jgi:hypothetical protein